ncbi:MAG: YqaJ viral recombinase family protein [Solirubrobacterales bacterium]|nr:YqaJ viral recombinase family protein [Solirubrobacterales bacterium]
MPSSYLGASQFAGAIGISPYGSRAELWRLMTRRKTFDGNVYTQHGNDSEPLAVAAYEAHTGEIVTDQQRWYSLEYLGAHIDGRVGDRTTEFKCPFNRMYEDVPVYNMCQLQGQMHLAGVPHCHFVAWRFDELTRTESLRIWHVDYSEEYWLWMRPMLDEFWQMVQTDTEPPRMTRKPIPLDVERQRIA